MLRVGLSAQVGISKSNNSIRFRSLDGVRTAIGGAKWPTAVAVFSDLRRRPEAAAFRLRT